MTTMLIWVILSYNHSLSPKTHKQAMMTTKDASFNGVLGHDNDSKL